MAKYTKMEWDDRYPCGSLVDVLRGDSEAYVVGGTLADIVFKNGKVTEGIDVDVFVKTDDSKKKQREIKEALSKLGPSAVLQDENTLMQKYIIKQDDREYKVDVVYFDKNIKLSMEQIVEASDINYTRMYYHPYSSILYVSPLAFQGTTMRMEKCYYHRDVTRARVRRYRSRGYIFPNVPYVNVEDRHARINFDIHECTCSWVKNPTDRETTMIYLRSKIKGYL